MPPGCPSHWTSPSLRHTLDRPLPWFLFIHLFIFNHVLTMYKLSFFCRYILIYFNLLCIITVMYCVVLYYYYIIMLSTVGGMQWVLNTYATHTRTRALYIYLIYYLCTLIKKRHSLCCYHFIYREYSHAYSTTEKLKRKKEKKYKKENTLKQT